MTKVIFEQGQFATKMEENTNKDVRLFAALKRIAESAFNNLSLVAAPLLPATLFGLSVGEYLAATVDPLAGWVVGFISGFSIEAAGFNAFKAKEKSDKPILAVAYLAVGILITVILELEEWRRMVIGLSGFAIVAIVYWSIQTIDQAEAAQRRLEAIEAEAKRKEEEAAEAEQKRLEEAEKWEREQADKQAEFERQMKAQQAELRAQIKLQKAASYSNLNQQNTGKIPADWRQVSAAQKEQLALATRGEREKMFPDIAARTRAKWHERLDELADKLQ